jgi:hypothetical protein
LSFNGVNDYVEVPDSPSLDITEAITIEAWIYPVSSPQPLYRAGIINKGGWDFGGYEMLMGHDIDGWKEPLEFCTRTSCSYTKSRIPLNQWTHVAATFDNTDAILYLNGSIVPSILFLGGRINPLISKIDRYK